MQSNPKLKILITKQYQTTKIQNKLLIYFGHLLLRFLVYLGYGCSDLGFKNEGVLKDHVNPMEELFRLNMRRSILTFAMILMMPVLARAGWTENWESIRQDMSGVHSISAHFTQKKNLKILARPLVSDGRFYFRAPGDVRWEYIYPVKNVLLVHGDKVTQYVWTKDHFIKDSGPQLQATRIVMEQIASWLRGNFHDNSAFVPKLIPGKPRRIILIPNKDYLKNFIRRITLTLSGTSGVISTIEILEPQGSSTVLEFSHIALNAKISDTTFEDVK